MRKRFFYCIAVLLITACSGTKVIENSAYLESKALPTLNVPADMEFVELKTAYPIPDIEGSLANKTPIELEELKKAPDLLNKK